MAGVNHPVLGDPDYVRYAWVGDWDAEEVRRGFSGVNLCQTGGGDRLTVHASRFVVIAQEKLRAKSVAAVDRLLSQRIIPSSSMPNATSGVAFGFPP